jgi:hypothetical protein
MAFKNRRVSLLYLHNITVTTYIEKFAHLPTGGPKKEMFTRLPFTSLNLYTPNCWPLKSQFSSLPLTSAYLETQAHWLVTSPIIP